MNTNSKLGGRYVPGNNMPIEQAVKQLGNVIQAKRLSMNVTQEELSVHTGVSVGTIKRLEQGRPVSTENMIKVMIPLLMVKDLLSLYVEPEISLQERFELQQKKIKNKRQRASKN
ncbi:helix-turn-helix domain-containing protein [Thiomicrorhabdus aquaedulcis]|uniref:helix-turn-helix domain-containing protein n=1 Tax=Thiomicrorhabdus aquaedulcis TaxID=2211106 RepID=UPI000FD9DEBD|nr:helix-turn-helix transcriptional regulator [Thiomicrorhabdus aquaedulcis]